MRTLALAIREITAMHISHPHVTSQLLKEKASEHCPDFQTACLCFLVLHAAYFGGMWYEVQAWIAEELK